MKSVWTSCHSLLTLLLTLLRHFPPSSGLVSWSRAYMYQLPVLEHSYGITYATIGDCISTLACCVHCAKDPTCRSLLYEPATRSCRLNSQMSGDPPASLSWDGVIYGQIERRSNWLGAICPSTACSSYPNTACHEGTCTCVFGLSYHYNTDTCVPDCNAMQGYGTNFTRIPMILWDFDDLMIFNVDLEACKTACIDSTGFVCRSLEYFPGMCFLSSETVYTQPQAAEANESGRDPNFLFLVRDCL